MKKTNTTEQTTEPTTTKPSENNDDFRKILKEEMIKYLTTGEGNDLLKELIRRIVRDELFGDEHGVYLGDASTATRIEIRKLIREELFPEGTP